MNVAPFTILIDHRERPGGYRFESLPLRKKDAGGLVVPMEWTYLVTGDYTIKGLEDRVAIERKSLEDLYATLGQNHERFERELERLALMDFAAVVVEASQREIWKPQACRDEWRSALNPRAVEGFIVKYSIRYGVHFWPVGGRREGEFRVYSALESFWRHDESRGE